MISLSKDNRNHPVQIDAIHLPVPIQVGNIILGLIVSSLKQLIYHNVDITAIDSVIFIQITDSAT